MISQRLARLALSVLLLAALTGADGCPFFGLSRPEEHLPSCAFTSPPEGRVFEIGESVPVAYTIADEGDDLTKITLIVQGDPPLVVEPPVAGAGPYEYALDTSGRTTSSIHVQVTVHDSNSNLGGCERDVPLNFVRTPTVKTSLVGRLTPFYAKVGGEVTSRGLGQVYDRGVVWGTQPDPTVAGSKTEEDGELGSFDSHLRDLAQGTTYHVRAYATNASGTAYGEEITFTTPAAVFADAGTVTDVDLNSYKAVRIGDQVWMAENLRTRRYADGAGILDGSAIGACVDGPSSAYWFKYGNLDANVADYGLLYTGYVAQAAALCPAGWHVPSWEEIDALWTYLGGTKAGGKLKEAGTAHWDLTQADTTNASGFTALPGGWRGENGEFYDLGHNGMFWSRTPSTVDATKLYYFHLNSTHAGFIPGAEIRAKGKSVRCLKD